MDKLKRKLKRYPHLFSVARAVYRLRIIPMKIGDWLRRCYAMAFGKPYFGFHLASQQLSPDRVHAMRALITSARKPNLRVLEVGSWAGQSAILWASNLPENGTLTCVDHWQAADSSTSGMKAALKGDKIYKLFMHNIISAGVSKKIRIERMSSDDGATHLKDERYDIVYVDADHAYHQFRKDLTNYMKLVAEGGVVCGDDLEMQPDEVDKAFRNANKNIDYVTDPKTGRGYHPGINLAIEETFGSVSMANGFWAMRKVDASWQPVVVLES